MSAERSSSPSAPPPLSSPAAGSAPGGVSGAPDGPSPTAGAAPGEPDPTLARLVQFYEHLQPADLARLDQIYAPNARFKDPFNDVTGIAAIRGIFEHMFHQLHEPRFVVTERVGSAGPGGSAVLLWTFQFRFRTVSPEQTQSILGATHVRWNAQGQVVLHRDYWDAAEELYEKLPLLGGLMRWLKRRANG